MRKRPDDNQTEVVAGIRAIGATVAITSDVGDGFGDFVVGYRGENFIIELKDGSKPPSKRRLTPKEAEFHRMWRGQIDIANDLDEVLRIIGAIE